jgi:hypothetical protein
MSRSRWLGNNDPRERLNKGLELGQGGLAICSEYETGLLGSVDAVLGRHQTKKGNQWYFRDGLLFFCNVNQLGWQPGLWARIDFKGLFRELANHPSCRSSSVRA